MPRKQTHYLPTSSPTKQKKSTISQYFSTTSCACCEEQTQNGLCNNCIVKPQESMVILHDKVKNWEQKCFYTRKVSCAVNYNVYVVIICFYSCANLV